MKFKEMIKIMAQDFEPVLMREYEILQKKADNDLKTFYKQMAYSLFNGGKRLRAILLLKSFELFGGINKELAEKFAVAIECIHSYSLVHDDLPAMDNDDFRRGRPSSHKAFGEDIAILVGDGLLNMAFEIMSSAILEYKDDVLISSKAMNTIAINSGAMGMVGGQVLEIFFGENSQEKALKIEMLKTSKLFVASILAGGILAGVSEEELKILEVYAQNIGIAFQLKDDIMDESGPFKAEKAREKADFYIIEAINILEKLDIDRTFYIELANYMVNREL